MARAWSCCWALPATQRMCAHWRKRCRAASEWGAQAGQACALVHGCHATRSCAAAMHPHLNCLACLPKTHTLPPTAQAHHHHPPLLPPRQRHHHLEQPLPHAHYAAAAPPAPASRRPPSHAQPGPRTCAPGAWVPIGAARGGRGEPAGGQAVVFQPGAGGGGGQGQPTARHTGAGAGAGARCAPARTALAAPCAHVLPVRAAGHVRARK